MTAFEKQEWIWNNREFNEMNKPNFMIYLILAVKNGRINLANLRAVCVVVEVKFPYIITINF